MIIAWGDLHLNDSRPWSYNVSKEIIKTIIEFEVYLKELKDGVSEERRQELRNISTSTSDLINYSWEVVDTQDLSLNLLRN